MAYSNDSDLIEIRSNILDYGIADWSSKHDDAKRKIDRILASSWYKSIASDNNVDYIDNPFDSTKLLNSGTQLKELACYKTLELIYLELTKDTSEEDGFERQRKIFKALFNEELNLVLNSGLDYDWDSSGVVSLEEKLQPVKRRLHRS